MSAGQAARDPCPTCDGTGKVGPEGESWKAWLDLPLSASIAVVAGIVRPSPCPDCKGTGTHAQALETGRVE